MTATDSLTTAERIAEIETEIANVTAARGKRLRDIEDELAAGHDVSGSRKDVSRLDSSLEMAQATRRGLERQRIIEHRADHLTGISDAEATQVAAESAFADIIASREVAAADLIRIEGETVRLRVERDNSGIRVSRRRAAFANFCSVNADAIIRAEQLAANHTAGSPATSEVLA